MHPPLYYVCYQPYIKPCLFPIINSLTMYQAPHPINSWLPTLSHHVTCWPWMHYNPRPPSIGFPMRLQLSKYIQWLSWFCRWRIRPRPKWKMLHSLCRPLYFWCCCSLVRQKPTSLYSPFHRLIISHIFLGHQNDPMDPTDPTKPWISSLQLSKSHI